MKNILFIILLLPTLSYGQAVDTVNLEGGVEWNGEWYYKSGSDKPFTGVGVSYHENGKKAPN